MIGRILCWASSEGFVTDSLAVLGLSGVEQRVSGWRLVFLPRLPVAVSGWTVYPGHRVCDGATGSWAPGPTAHILASQAWLRGALQWARLCQCRGPMGGPRPP